MCFQKSSNKLLASLYENYVSSDAGIANMVVTEDYNTLETPEVGQINHPAYSLLAPDHKTGLKEKRKKAASFQTVSQLHKVRLTSHSKMVTTDVGECRQRVFFFQSPSVFCEKCCASFVSWDGGS